MRRLIIGLISLSILLTFGLSTGCKKKTEETKPAKKTEEKAEKKAPSGETPAEERAPESPQTGGE